MLLKQLEKKIKMGHAQKILSMRKKRYLEYQTLPMFVK